MKMYNILRQYSAIVGVLFFVIVLSVVCTYRWSTQTVAAQNKVITKSKGLTLSPLRSELNIAPGTSLDGVLTVTNSTNKSMKVDLNAEEFSVINQQYDYAFTAESNVAKWVSFSLSEINLKPNDKQQVKYSVGVPLSAEPGGRYISLFASTDTGTSEGGIESRQRVASLLYITVLGDVTRSGHLVSLTSPWLISGNSIWSTALQNTGTTHFRSRYNVLVKNLLGDGEVASMSGEAMILPGTVRAISDTQPLPKLPGIYRIVYNIGLGDTPAITETRYAIYMPPWATLIVAIVIVVLIWLWRRRLTKH